MTEVDLQGDLPPGWVWTTIEDIYDIVGGGTPSTKVEEYWQGDIPWITSADIYGLNDIRPRKFITEKAILDSATNFVSAGSIVVVTRVSLGRVAITDYPLCFSQDSQALINETGLINAAYALYYLSLVAQLFKYQSRGTTISGITKKQLAELEFPLAPLAEQQRIVGVIELQFTRLDAGVAALKRLRANLKRYKAAVLKAACEGKLVEQDPDDEPASELLKRILKERRAKWAAEQRAKGKDPRKLTYKEPAAPDTADLPDLPEGWVWATTEQLAAVEKYAMAIGPFGSNLMVKDYRLEGIPLIFVKEIRSGVFDRPDLPRISPEKAEELRSHHVHPGDLVITKMGDPPGDVSIFPDNIPLAVATSDCIKWTLSQYLPNRRYFLYGIRFPIVKNQILKITRGVAQQKMSLARFKGVSIPVAPLSEQNRIVDAIDETLSNISDISELIDANLKRAERLRQSILREAFAGRLVPQDPNDEPAGELLKHIRRDRTRQTNEKKRR